ncbi:MAG: hypothetical protein ABIJ26_03555 [Candidatus Margulisiibacteriota bacterium]|nr:hypothetical protein [Candidatus Margulisiibacteriota bacterium]
MRVFCEDCKKDMTRISGTYALTGVTKDRRTDKINFDPGSGVPVVAYVCTQCNRIKIYSAVRLGEI